ncbi:MAG: hypothetical protein M1830_003366 [Pleopsidium flavum]|nr:MAG: hypothetical protein M1830_003366 [Pleopsidium flavum]
MERFNSRAVKYIISESEDAKGFTNTSQMPRQNKRSTQQIELTAAARQRKMEPAAFENLTLGEASNHDGAFGQTDHHYSRTQSRGAPDLYRPSDTRASSTWRWGESVSPKLQFPMPDDVAEAVLGYLQSRTSKSKPLTQPTRSGTIAASLPRPNRTGTTQSQTPREANRREGESVQTQIAFTSINSASSIWRPDPTIPPYVPSQASPLGVRLTSHAPSGNGFTAYQPLRSVGNFRNVPPWRIDKFHRFTHTVATQSGPGGSADHTPISRGRWSGSPPRLNTRYSLRSNNPQPPSVAQQTSRRSPASEESDYRRSRNTVKPLPIPEPTSQYLQQARFQPRKSNVLRPLLLVVDLNGTLVERKKGTSRFVARPNLARFLNYVFANHTLIIWSSAHPDNVTKVCQSLFSEDQRRKVVGEWGRDTLGLTAAQFKEKVQVYKRLDKIWQNETLRHTHPEADKGGKWDQSNTILIDDSRLKAAAQPHNLLEIPEFKNRPEQSQTDVLKQVAGYLEELRLQADVSAFIRKRSFRVDDGWSRPWPEELTGQG